MSIKLYESLNSKLSIIYRLSDGTAQLVRTRGVLESATNAFQALQHLINFHAIHQSAHALCVSVAAAVELHILQNAVFDFKLNGLAACALGSVSVFHIYKVKVPEPVEGPV